MNPNDKLVRKAVIYARCSTEESRQDTENQLRELRRYCGAYGWPLDEVAEYDSGFRGTQPKLQAVLERIRRKDYDVLLVFSLDRFSRQHPSKVNALLDQVVYQFGCRFIALQEGLDSQNEMVWQVIKPLFSWFAHVYSRNLSEKIKLGIKTKRESGSYCGGRPKKIVDADRLKALLLTRNGDGWRTLAQKYNGGLSPREQVSFSLLRRVAKQLQFGSEHSADGVAKPSTPV